jgi:hypothetical protein
MQNAISQAQFNVLERIIAMSTSAADLIGTCACAQDVQFKWILVADLGFFWQCVYPSSLRDASLSQSMGTSQAGQKQIHFCKLGLSTFKSYLTASG